MGFNCHNCKLYFVEKPTHKTECTQCNQRLTFVSTNIYEYNIIGKSKIINNEKCGCCAKLFKKSEKRYDLVNAVQCTDTEWSFKMHTKCYNQECTPQEKIAFNIKLKL